jgi:hypothetical protein
LKAGAGLAKKALFFSIDLPISGGYKESKPNK